MKRTVVGLCGACAVGLLLFAGREVAADLRADRDLHEVAYVGSAECRRCHEDHYASWHRTYHRTMTREAGAESVLGDFDGAQLDYLGVTATMHREGGRFLITFAAAGGRGRRTVEVVRTVGSHRYQQYLAREGDLYVRLPVAWHVEERRWFHMNGAFLTPDPEEPPPGGSVSKTDYDRHVVSWNDNCVFCHNVAPNPGWNEATRRYDTHVAELGVACESCHGPGGAHVARNANPLRRYALHLGDAADPTIRNPKRLSPERSAEICGRCHGQRIAEDVAPFLVHGDPFVPGDVLSDYTTPLARDTELGGAQPFAPRFWPDGTPRLTAYEYQGLLMSPCEGLTCTSCHGMHDGDPRGQIRPGLDGDAMCTQCHEELAGGAAKRAHAAHEPAEVGCVDCHMPRIVYGLVSVHPSHRIEIPDPARTDRPNACALCHSPEDLLTGDPIERAIAVAAMSSRASAASPASSEARRRGGVETRAQRGGSSGGPPPGVAWRGGAPPSRSSWLLHVMEHDRYPAVRRIAWRSLGTLVPDVPRSVLDAYEATDRLADRRAAIAAIEAALPFEVERPDPALAAELAARADELAIEIGE